MTYRWGGGMKRKALWIAILLLCGALPPVLIGDVHGAPSDEWQKTLLVAVNGEPQTFDPAVNVASVSAFRFYPNVYETLVQCYVIGREGEFRMRAAVAVTGTTVLLLGFTGLMTQPTAAQQPPDGHPIHGVLG